MEKLLKLSVELEGLDYTLYINEDSCGNGHLDDVMGEAVSITERYLAGESLAKIIAAYTEFH